MIVSTSKETVEKAIATLREPHYTFAKVPNTIRQSLADIVASLLEERESLATEKLEAVSSLADALEKLNELSAKGVA